MSGVKHSRIGVPSHARYIYARIKGSKGVMPVITSLRKFSTSEVAQERMRIISFYDRYGEHATKEAFNTNRKTICVWKKRIRHGNQHLVALTPQSTRPHTPRGMQVDTRLVAYIRKERELYPRRSKEKLKPFVDQEAERLDIPPIATSTIGKVIKRNNLFFFKGRHIYHNPASKWGHQKRKQYVRVRQAPNPDLFGYLEMDTITKVVDAIKVYIYTAVDVRMKFSYAYPYTRLNSQNTVDFFKKLQLLYPVPIREVQTDNGLEFLGDFEAYLASHGIRHVFTYPRCPKINGCIERYNRTIQEEFLDEHLHLVHDPTLFCSKLANWLIYYNCYRVHQSLGLKSPMDYLVTNGGMSKKSVACTIN